MSIWRHTLLRRVGFWALLQALPSESALKTYLRSVFLALCSAVIGSILLGSLLSVGMIVLYEALVMNGVEPWIAGLGMASLGILALLLCLVLFFRSIRQIALVQMDTTTEMREAALQTPAGRIIDAIKSGLSAGYSQ